MTREQIKAKILQDSLESRYVLAELATGVGKTLIGIDFVSMHLDSGRFLWVVPQTNLIQNVKDEFVKWNMSHLIPYGDFICYASLEKYSDTYYDCIILDEVHNSSSLIRLNALAKRNYYKCLGLSATVSDEIKEVLNVLGDWKTTKVTLTDAIESDILAEPKINIIYSDLDNTKKVHPYKFKSGEHLLTAREYYDTVSSSITYWKDRYENEGQQFAFVKMQSLGGERQRFLANAKEESVAALLEELGNERYICFCGSVEQAKRLGKNVCSSKTGKVKNAKLIEDFNSGKLSNILAKGMLQEGQNLVNTKYGIIIQLGNKEKTLVQQVGRAIRHSEPQIYIFIVRGTVDERFLQSSFKSNKNLIS